MSTRERILTIRLLDKVKKYPAYTKALGITAQKEKPVSPKRPVMTVRNMP